jgi:LPPG:FO 2-phospho-L-lactate transferase
MGSPGIETAEYLGCAASSYNLLVQVCAISGGVGSARFCAGLVRNLNPRELTIVVNTGDDERIRGLLICPDIDTVLYHLSASTEWTRGWGLAGETFVSDERYKDLAQKVGGDVDLQQWFALGDRDLATHQLRARLLDGGRTLTQTTAALARALGIEATVLPMSDDTIRTRLTNSTGEELDFQEYFVHRHQRDEIVEVAYDGAVKASPADGVVDAIAGADVVVIPPSNPILSIAPALAVAGIHSALAAAKGVRIGVSPIVGGKALKGPADRVLASLGHDVSPAGVARLYDGLLDAFVVDETDASYAPAIEELGMRAVVCDTIMSGPEEAARVVKTILDHVASP